MIASGTAILIIDLIGGTVTASISLSWPSPNVVFNATETHCTPAGDVRLINLSSGMIVSGHSALELTAIVISGAAGLRLGLAVIAPGKRTRFSKNFMAGAASIADAVQAYSDAVKSGRFPGPEHAFE